MTDIIVHKKDGTIIDHMDKGAPGGSYCNKIRCEGAFIIITDPYGKETYYPAADISSIEHEASRRF